MLAFGDFVIFLIDGVIDGLSAGREVSPTAWLVSGLLLTLFVLAAVVVVVFYLY